MFKKLLNNSYLLGFIFGFLQAMSHVIYKKIAFNYGLLKTLSSDLQYVSLGFTIAIPIILLIINYIILQKKELSLKYILKFSVGFIISFMIFIYFKTPSLPYYIIMFLSNVISRIGNIIGIAIIYHILNYIIQIIIRKGEDRKKLVLNIFKSPLFFAFIIVVLGQISSFNKVIAQLALQRDIVLVIIFTIIYLFYKKSPIKESFMIKFALWFFVSFIIFNILLMIVVYNLNRGGWGSMSVIFFLMGGGIIKLGVGGFIRSISALVSMFVVNKLYISVNSSSSKLAKLWKLFFYLTMALTLAIGIYLGMVYFNHH
ncbi:hypothetical protein ACFL0U_04375 [Pseudomonadota bacterium]